MLLQILCLPLCILAFNLAWAQSCSLIAYKYFTIVTLICSTCSICMAFSHTQIQTHQYLMSHLEFLRTAKDSVDLFLAHTGQEKCMASLLKSMLKKLIRKLPCVLLRSVPLIIVTKYVVLHCMTSCSK